ncbi:hypothetical protein PN441_12510 [Spirulina major CS-329]|uniref:hypothetical protein n=1 Tax=Spirulina TaxID=1154 RepID=UPI00232EE9C5|nr:MULTISPECIES: hypothetical protein [Spirulina]MDB9494772.1 hypothetical protein [Spirulina subsalsa CS-330]MDB9503894.1 hypothetical protein [Spirulina major CS-329]
MTLDKHKLDGIAQITAKTLPTTEFENLLLAAGYEQVGSAPAKGNRIKVWWTHPQYRQIEAIYSPDGNTAITAYHVAD